MSTFNLIECLINKDIRVRPDIPKKILSTSKLGRKGERLMRNCPKSGVKTEVLRNLSKRVVTPIFIPLICLISCFMLVANKTKDKGLKKYLVFSLGFIILVTAEIIGRYSGNSYLNSILYFITPIITILITYLFLIYKLNFEKRHE